MSMCESILTIALVCTVKYLHYCDYYYTLGNDSQSTPKLIAYYVTLLSPENLNFSFLSCSFTYVPESLILPQPLNEIINIMTNTIVMPILLFFFFISLSTFLIRVSFCTIQYQSLLETNFYKNIYFIPISQNHNRIAPWRYISLYPPKMSLACVHTHKVGEIPFHQTDSAVIFQVIAHIHVHLQDINNYLFCKRQIIGVL